MVIIKGILISPGYETSHFLPAYAARYIVWMLIHHLPLAQPAPKRALQNFLVMTQFVL